MKEIRKDILGVTPQIGDTIIYNPPHYKGLVYGICVGFSKVGLPLVDIDNPNNNYLGNKTDGFYSPKTGFTVTKANNFLKGIERFVKDGITINGNSKDGYRVFTEKTQWFKVASLTELSEQKFEAEIEKLQYYDANFKKIKNSCYDVHYQTDRNWWKFCCK